MLKTALVLAVAVIGFSHSASAQEMDLAMSRPLTSRSVIPLPPRRGQGGTVYALVSRAAERHGVPHALAHGVAHVESGHRCVNTRYRGPMQILQSTARSVGISATTCEASIEAGMRYLAKMYRLTGGNHCLAATAYNQGHVAGCNGYGRRVLRSANS